MMNRYPIYLLLSLVLSLVLSPAPTIFAQNTELNKQIERIQERITQYELQLSQCGNDQRCQQQKQRQIDQNKKKIDKIQSIINKQYESASLHKPPPIIE